MASPSPQRKPPSKEPVFTNFLYFLVPRTLLNREREKRAQSAKAIKKREAVQDLIYPWRAKRAAPAKDDCVAEEVDAVPDNDKGKGKEGKSVAETVKLTPKDGRKKGKKVTFAMEEPQTTPEHAEEKGKHLELNGKE